MQRVPLLPLFATATATAVVVATIVVAIAVARWWTVALAFAALLAMLALVGSALVSYTRDEQ
jgi:hypothetical protein